MMAKRAFPRDIGQNPTTEEIRAYMADLLDWIAKRKRALGSPLVALLGSPVPAADPVEVPEEVPNLVIGERPAVAPAFDAAVA